MRWRSDRDHWGAITIAVHWVSALAVFALFALGLWMTELNLYHRWYHDAPALHKGVGALLFLLSVARLLWRLVTGRPRELTGHRPFERTAAKWVHVLLYLLLFGVILSGYLISTADGRAISVFGWFSLPATLYGIEGQEDIAGEVHRLLAWSLIGLALLHGAAALKHHFIDRDLTLLRMLGR